MNNSKRNRLRAAAIVIAVASPVVTHIALAMGQGYGGPVALPPARTVALAVALAAVQAVATGVVLATSLPLRRAREIAAFVTVALLAALALGAAYDGALGAAYDGALGTGPDGAPGARHDGATALLAMAGTAHALLYTALLILFGRTLLPGRTPLVTGLAARLNPSFHAGMRPYTRGVTWAWVGLFSGQLALSALLLRTNLGLWQTFVTIYHLPLDILAALTEALIRRWRWRHEHATSLSDTVIGVRRLMRGAANQPAAPPDAQPPAAPPPPAP